MKGRINLAEVSMYSQQVKHMYDELHMLQDIVQVLRTELVKQERRIGYLERGAVASNKKNHLGRPPKQRVEHGAGPDVLGHVLPSTASVRAEPAGSPSQPGTSYAAKASQPSQSDRDASQPSPGRADPRPVDRG